MAEPTTKFGLIPQNTPLASLNSPANRLAFGLASAALSTGPGNEADFGMVDISAAIPVDSDIVTVLWYVSNGGGNTSVEAFKLWASGLGFDQASSVQYVSLEGDSSPNPPMLTYVFNATHANYSGEIAPMATGEPGQNMWPSDEGVSMVTAPAGDSDDIIMWAMYAHVLGNETTGLYKGTDVGMELEYSFKYSYS